jgi:hypothetical protein
LINPANESCEISSVFTDQHHNCILDQAVTPIKVVRQPFSNGEAIKLDFQAQEQMKKGDLTSAARTTELAMQKDPTLWLTYYMP